MQKKPLNIVLTGGNSGIGFQTMKDLYLRGHNVVFGSRNQNRNQEAVMSICKQEKQGLEKNDHFIKDFVLDLSSKKSIQSFAAEVKKCFKHIDILINNAGLALGQLSRNQDGIEMTLAINHFGHFYLTYLLFDVIETSPEARIINVSSELHYSAPKNILEDIECKDKSYGWMEQYNISKIMNVIFTQELSRKLSKSKSKNIKTFSLHPGVVSSNFGSELGMFKCFRILCCCMFVQNPEGARTSIYLATQDFSKLRNGQYYDKDTSHREMDKRGRDLKLAEELWKMSEKVYGIKFDPFL